MTVLPPDWGAKIATELTVITFQEIQREKSRLERPERETQTRSDQRYCIKAQPKSQRLTLKTQLVDIPRDATVKRVTVLKSTVNASKVVFSAQASANVKVAKTVNPKTTTMALIGLLGQIGT